MTAITTTTQPASASRLKQATIRFLSGGRYILGIGAAGREDEYRAYGYDFPTANARVEQLDEALQIIKALWAQERTSFQGKHYQVSEAWCEPKPEVLPTMNSASTTSCSTAKAFQT